MKLLEFLVHAFVNTFGITQPTAEGRARAARYLGVFLIFAALVAAALGFSLYSRLHS